MTEESREAYEHHLGRELPNAGAFGPALAGAAFLFFSRFQPANFPPRSRGRRFIFFFLSAISFSFRSVVRLDNHKGTVEKTINTFIWKGCRNYSAAEFTGVGIGMGGGSPGGGVTSKGRYFVRVTRSQRR